MEDILLCDNKLVEIFKSQDSNVTGNSPSDQGPRMCPNSSDPGKELANRPKGTMSKQEHKPQNDRKRTVCDRTQTQGWHSETVDPAIQIDYS